MRIVIKQFAVKKNMLQLYSGQPKIKIQPVMTEPDVNLEQLHANSQP